MTNFHRQFEQYSRFQKRLLEDHSTSFPLPVGSGAGERAGDGAALREVISKNVFFAGDLPDATDVAGIIRISAVNQERII